MLVLLVLIELTYITNQGRDHPS